MTKRKVVILGGYGTFGRHIAENLSALSDAQVTVAGRHPDKGMPFATSLGVDFRQCDANDSTSLKNAVEDAWLVRPSEFMTILRTHRFLTQRIFSISA